MIHLVLLFRNETFDSFSNTLCRRSKKPQNQNHLYERDFITKNFTEASTEPNRSDSSFVNPIHDRSVNQPPSLWNSIMKPDLELLDTLSLALALIPLVENRFPIPPVSIVCSQDLTSQATSINIIRETHRFLVTGVHLLFRCGRELYSPGEKKVSQPFH